MTLDEKLQNLPVQPGCYLHKGASGEILYVGKAKNLRNRVRQYFQSSRSMDPKTQELVARIDSRGHVNRRLAGLTIATNVIPPAGSAVMVDGERRGTITSVGESLALRAPVALAMLRREVGAGDLVSVEWDGGTTPATVHDLPLDDFSTTSD